MSCTPAENRQTPCAEYVGPGDPWFDQARIGVALRICATCPVTAACAELGKDEPFGIWGGTLPAERGFSSTGKSRAGLITPQMAHEARRLVALHGSVIRASEESGISTHAIYRRLNFLRKAS